MEVFNRRLVAAALILAFNACASPDSASLTTSHSRAITDSVKTFLAEHERIMSTWPVGDAGRPLFSDSIVLMADVLPADPLMIHGYDALAAGGARPAWLSDFAYVTDSAVILPVAPGVASVATFYTETITDSTGRVTRLRGMAQLLLRHESNGWRIRMATSSHPDSASISYQRLVAGLEGAPH